MNINSYTEWMKIVCDPRNNNIQEESECDEADIEG